MSLIYGYNYEKDDDNSEDVSDLEKLVGEKTDSSGDNTAFGKIQKNKEEILEKSTLLGLKADDRTVDTAFGRIQKNTYDIQIKNLLMEIRINLTKTDILNNKTNLETTTLTLENLSSGKDGFVKTNKLGVATNKADIATKSVLLGSKTDAKDVDTAFGRIRKNKEDIVASTSFVGSSSSMEGESTLKGTQLSHASAITAHSNNLLKLESDVGTKTDIATTDSAFGRIQKNKENIEKLKHAVELKETTGTFVAPLNDGKVEITGWSMTRYSTIIAIIIKAEQTLLGVSRVTLYSGTSWANNSHTMTVPMALADMKLARPAVIIHTKDPGHAKMYANTRGNAIGSVGERTVTVKFIYIDHTTPILN